MGVGKSAVSERVNVGPGTKEEERLSVLTRLLDMLFSSFSSFSLQLCFFFKHRTRCVFWVWQPAAGVNEHRSTVRSSLKSARPFTYLGTSFEVHCLPHSLSERSAAERGRQAAGAKSTAAFLSFPATVAGREHLQPLQPTLALPNGAPMDTDISAICRRRFCLI